jgi:hypothetical protein
MALYDGCFMYVNGQLLAENTSLDISIEGDNQPVLTTVKGYAGESPSPKMTMIQADNVIPVTGFEVDIIQKFNDSEEVEAMVQFGGNGKKLKSKGTLLSPKISSGVGKVTTMSFGFRGTPGKFE